MSLAKLSLIFRVIIIGIVYMIIFLALKIMYKDIKNSGNKKRTKKKTIGLEVIENGENNNLSIGDIIPISNEITIGRNKNNLLTISDEYVSSFHAKISLKNTDYFLRDFNSTNGTLLNYKKISNPKIIKIGDEIKIGTAIFKVIG